MTKYNRVKIKRIKSKVKAMLKEYRHLPQSEEINPLSPSKYWNDFCSYFDYMLNLPEESFFKLRLHTYHLTGDNYQTYYFGDPQAFKTAANLDMLVKDIPSRFILNEPKSGIGFSYSKGRFVSWDIVRYQKVVNTLYRYNFLSTLLRNKQKRKYVLEIGAGYGGLAHHLSNIFKNATYIIIDLPETLLFSAAYLSLLNPRKNIYIYDKKDFSKFITSSAIKSYDFILVPNYRLHSLRHLRFDLVINIASFQEMNTEQVDTYLDFISKTCLGLLYSLNQERQKNNKELHNPLSEILSKRFELTEVFQTDESQTKTEQIKIKFREVLKSIAIIIGLLDRPKPGILSTGKYREFICKPFSRKK